jgi:endo-alpha-1,4-polygalactosaminidase (GH114 family)
MVFPVIGLVGAAASDMALTALFGSLALAFGIGAYNDTVDTHERVATRKQLRKESKLRMKKLNKAVSKEIKAQAKAAVNRLPVVETEGTTVDVTQAVVLSDETEKLLRQQLQSVAATQIDLALGKLGPDVEPEVREGVRAQLMQQFELVQEQLIADQLRETAMAVEVAAAKLAVTKDKSAKKSKKKGKAVLA